VRLPIARAMQLTVEAYQNPKPRIPTWSLARKKPLSPWLLQL
jgi:hypothetical protein